MLVVNVNNSQKMPLWHFNGSYWRMRIQNALLLPNLVPRVLSYLAFVARERQILSSSQWSPSLHLFVCHLLKFSRHVTSPNQGLFLSRHGGRVEEDPGNEVRPDHLQPRVLKECAAEIVRRLAYCWINQSLLEHFRMPRNKLTLDPKHADKENYRQISLTSIECKVCEKIVKEREINFWQDLWVLDEIHFGFLEGKSTVTQLLTCYYDWVSSRNKSTPTDVVFLDFTKAFYSVPHKRLLLKLKGYQCGIQTFR